MLDMKLWIKRPYDGLKCYEIVSAEISRWKKTGTHRLNYKESINLLPHKSGLISF